MTGERQWLPYWPCAFQTRLPEHICPRLPLCSQLSALLCLYSYFIVLNRMLLCKQVPHFLRVFCLLTLSQAIWDPGQSTYSFVFWLLCLDWQMPGGWLNYFTPTVIILRPDTCGVSASFENNFCLYLRVRVALFEHQGPSHLKWMRRCEGDHLFLSSMSSFLSPFFVSLTQQRNIKAQLMTLDQSWVT